LPVRGRRRLRRLWVVADAGTGGELVGLVERVVEDRE
jgi:hypothetical protein